jgi:hypothetical protein
MNYQTLNTIFVNSTRWGAYETLTFNLLLTLHTSLLFMAIPADDYGTVGTLLSCVYMITTAATMGNDITTGLMIGSSPSRSSIIRAIAYHAIHAFVVSICVIALLLLQSTSIINTSYAQLILLGICLAYSEISRKVIKSILLATYHFKPVAHTEIASIIAYMVLIWGLYSGGYFLTPARLITPLLFCSLVTNGILLVLLYRLCHALPSGVIPLWKPTFKIKARASLSCMTNFLFSGNLIVPLTAAFVGNAYAGGMKLASTVIQSGISTADRTFCVTSSLLFAQTKDNATIKQVLRMIARSMLPLLTGGALCVYALLYSLMFYKGLTTLLPTIFLFLLMQFCGIISSIFERLLLAQEQTHLMYLHLVTVFIGGTILYMGKCVGYQNMLIILVSIRLIFLITVMYWASYIWMQQTDKSASCMDVEIEKNTEEMNEVYFLSSIKKNSTTRINDAE